jgi:hypothetical protein
MDISIVKRSSPPDEDRTILSEDGHSWRVAVHVVHDLPHLVVESFFGLDDGLWGELATKCHAAAARAVTARDPKRRKLGRIVSGAATGAPTGDWLSEGHRVAKTATNAVANRWGDGPDTPSGVRQRLSRDETSAVIQLLGRIDDVTIGLAIRGVRDLDRQWAETPRGGVLRLQWPLPRSALEQGPDEP